MMLNNDTIQIIGIEESWLLSVMEKRGKELYGLRFSIRNEDIVVIRKLFAYFLKDQEHTSAYDICLTKGLLLSGAVGCGKTSLMTIMKLFLILNKRHIIKPTREISYEFCAEGFEVINHYSKKSFHSSGSEWSPIHYCFDDLGREKPIKYFGNECDVMSEIILSRYDLFIRCGMKTHFTTNLSIAELETRYGEHIMSRLCEMVNFIDFNNEIDKRRYK